MRSFRVAALIFCLHLALPTSSPQQPAQSQATPPPQLSTAGTAAPVPPVTQQIRSTVGFLMVAYRNGPIEGGVIGTCFFVSVPDKRLGENGSFNYLVTNRHVAQPGVDL